VVDIDRNYMRLALREAKKGIGRTSPNPCVGAVVVKNNKVIGKGYHTSMYVYGPNEHIWCIFVWSLRVSLMSEISPFRPVTNS